MNKNESNQNLSLNKNVPDEVKEVNELPIKKGKKRCFECKNKVGFTGFNCECGKLLCGLHRYPDSHSCTIDDTKRQKEILKDYLQEIKTDKIEVL